MWSGESSVPTQGQMLTLDPVESEIGTLPFSRMRSSACRTSPVKEAYAVFSDRRLTRANSRRPTQGPLSRGAYVGR